VHTLVTLGTPHRGTKAASLVPHPLVRQLRPGSDLIRELAAPAPGCTTRFVAFWSDLDEVIHPQRNALLAHQDLDARNVAVHGIGHLSLPIDGRVAWELARLLAQSDPGHGVTVGSRDGAGSEDHAMASSGYSAEQIEPDLSDLA
jgi:hypothetical protein